MQETSTIRTPTPGLATPQDSTLDANAGLISQALIGRVAPAAARTRRSRGSERYYVGRRPHETEVYVVRGTEIERLAHPGYQSNAAFDWGERTAGALELAFAMLAHTTDSRPPHPICLTFWTDVVACLDRAGFVLGDGDIALWLLTAFCAGDGSRPEPAPGRPRSRQSRAVGWLRSWLRRR
jgi:hypothetical protein